MSERSEIARDGMRAQKNSGRGQIQKGDATFGPFVVDIKEYSKSFSISKSVWAKICTDAIRSGGYDPALKLVLGTDSKVRLWVVEDGVIQDYVRLLELEKSLAK